MANPTSNFNWQMPTSSDLVTDLPADFEVFGQAVDTSLADLKGGTTGQVLKKNSNTDMDFVWGADSAGMTNPMTTTGDTIYSSSGSTPARLGIGSTGQILTVSGGLPAWATPSGSTLAISSIASGTMTSGSSLSITGLSSYDYVEFMASGIEGTSTTDVSLRINSNSGANYSRTSMQQSASTTDSQYSSITGTFDTAYLMTTMGQKGGATDGVLRVRFMNCKAVGFTTITASFFYGGPSNTPKRIDWSMGSYNVAEAVSSFQLNLSSGTFIGGGYRVLAG
jgi:hypothetical protein